MRTSADRASCAFPAYHDWSRYTAYATADAAIRTHGTQAIRRCSLDSSGESTQPLGGSYSGGPGAESGVDNT